MLIVAAAISIGASELLLSIPPKAFVGLVHIRRAGIFAFAGPTTSEGSSAAGDTAAASPMGLFCGPTLGLKMKLKFTDTSHVDINFMAYGSPQSCPQELYDFDVVNGRIGLQKSDCIKTAFRRIGDDLRFAYMPSEDMIQVTYDQANTYLSPAWCS